MKVTVDVTALAELPEVVARLQQRVVELENKLAALPQAAASGDELLTVAEAAAIDGRSLGAFRRAVHRGRIPSVRRGRGVFVRRGDLAKGVA